MFTSIILANLSTMTHNKLKNLWITLKNYFDLLTWMSTGIIDLSKTIHLPSLKLLEKGILELSIVQSVGDHIHRIQRLMLRKGAKRLIWDDITWFPKYFWQMTIARSRDINKDDTSILNLFKKLLVSQTLRYSFNRGNSNSEILYRGVCDAETFNDQT